LIGLASCASRRQPVLQQPEVLHVVLVKLKNPADAQELVNDTQRTLGLTSDAHALTPGVALGVKRPEVDDDYTVAFVMEFRDADCYQRYLESEAHKGLVARWLPRAERLRAMDIQRAYAHFDFENDTGGEVKKFKEYGAGASRRAPSWRERLTTPSKSE
jgi:hypothetical protein